MAKNNVSTQQEPEPASTSTTIHGETGRAIVISISPAAIPESERATTTVPGGRYVKDGRFVNANGEDLGPAN